MANATGKTRCIICEKEKATLRCGGCLQEFCFHHLEDHRQELDKQFDEIEVNRDLFLQSLTEYQKAPGKSLLTQQIDEWERSSIEKIQRTAEEARRILLENSSKHIHQIQKKLKHLTDQLRESRQENDFNEINLRYFNSELQQLSQELTTPYNISIREHSKPFIKKITVNVTGLSTSQFNIHPDARWLQDGSTVAGKHADDGGFSRLNQPIGICVDDDDQSVYVADYKNHRIMQWQCGETDGRVVAGGNEGGNQTNQLNHPSDVIIDRDKNNLIICDSHNRRIVQWSLTNGTNGQILISNIGCARLTIDADGYLYVSDTEKHEIRRWKMTDTCGTLVAGGNGRGNRLNQLDYPTFVFVDENHFVYVSDWGNDRVIKWTEGATEGIVVAGGQGKGNALSQLSNPQGLIVDQLGTIYVADRGNNRIMRWLKGATQGSIVVDGNRASKQPDQLNAPMGLSFDRQGNLYIVDCGNDRVQRFDLNQS